MIKTGLASNSKHEGGASIVANHPRVNRGWSEQKLADDLGCTERYIGRLKCNAKCPTHETLADIAESIFDKALFGSRGRRAPKPELLGTLTATATPGTPSLD